MNATRLIGIALGMSAGAVAGWFVAKQTMLGFMRFELYVVVGATIGAVFGLMVKPSDKKARKVNEGEVAEEEQPRRNSDSDGVTATWGVFVPILASLAVIGLAFSGFAIYKHMAAEDGSASGDPDPTEEQRDIPNDTADLESARRLAKTLYEATSVTWSEVCKDQIGLKVYIKGEVGEVSGLSDQFESEWMESKTGWEPASEGLTHVVWAQPDWNVSTQELGSKFWLRDTSFYVLVTEDEGANLKRGQAYKGQFEVVGIEKISTQTYVYLRPSSS